MTWDEMIVELRKEYPDVIGKAERIAEQLSGHISKLDAYEVLTKCYNHRTEVQHEALREVLSRVPTIDVAPVVHGKWMTKEYEYGDPEAGISDMWVDRPAEPSDDYAFCPVCGNDAGYTGEGCLILSNYCPNCGAKMDKEDT